MNILLYKDGRLLIDEGNPMEGVSLDGLAVCLLDPQEGDVLTFDGGTWRNAAPAEPAVVLYVTEVKGDDDVRLDKTWQDIATATYINHAVFVATDYEGFTYISPLSSFGYSEGDGYTVTAGDATYKAETATGTLIRVEAGAGQAEAGA